MLPRYPGQVERYMRSMNSIPGFPAERGGGDHAAAYSQERVHRGGRGVGGEDRPWWAPPSRHRIRPRPRGLTAPSSTQVSGSTHDPAVSTTARSIRSCDLFGGRVGMCVGHRNAEPLAGMQGIDIGQPVEGGKRPGIETVAPAMLASVSPGATSRAPDTNRLVPSCCLRSRRRPLEFTQVRDDDDLRGHERWRFSMALAARIAAASTPNSAATLSTCHRAAHVARDCSAASWAFATMTPRGSQEEGGESCRRELA